MVRSKALHHLLASIRPRVNPELIATMWMTQCWNLNG